MGLFNFFRKKPVEPEMQYDSNFIVEQLDELGYFKYAASNDIGEIKAHLIDSLTHLNYLDSVYFDESPFNSKDYRHYHFDGEDLYEEGGFLWQFDAMKTLFDKMNFKLDISNHIEDWNEATGLNHSITLNGKDYIIFKNFQGYGWGEAAQRFAEIINEQLALQHKNERLYLSNGGNDGNAVFLTEEQFAILDPILKGIDKPLNVKEWCRLHQVDEKKRHQG